MPPQLRYRAIRGLRGLLPSTQNATTTRITFTRLLSTGDSKDFVIPNAAIYMIWAYSPTKGSSPTSYPQHTVYNFATINFLNAGAVIGTPAPTTPAPSTSPPVAATAPSYTTPNGVMSVRWNVTATTITFTVVANVTGWVSIGLNSAALMAGADMYIGYVSSGTVVVQDAFSTGHSQPQADTSNGGTSDVTNLSGSQVRASAAHPARWRPRRCILGSPEDSPRRVAIFFVPRSVAHGPLPPWAVAGGTARRRPHQRPFSLHGSSRRATSTTTRLPMAACTSCTRTALPRRTLRCSTMCTAPSTST